MKSPSYNIFSEMIQGDWEGEGKRQGRGDGGKLWRFVSFQKVTKERRQHSEKASKRTLVMRPEEELHRGKV